LARKFRKNIIKKTQEIAPFLILSTMILGYFLVLNILIIYNLNRFKYSAFDIGIFDQGVWLLSTFEKAFVTVRGLHIFGDHLQFILLFVTPFYWIWNNIRFLLILQTFGLAIGAVPIYLLAKQKLKNKWLPLIFSFCYLMYPALHYLNLENFHPSALAVPMIIFSFYFLENKKYKPFLTFLFLALICKEEIVITAFFMGIYTFFKHNKKLGISICLFSLIWLFLVFKVILPFYNDFGYIHVGYGAFGEFGKSPTEAIFNMIKNPAKVVQKIATEQNIEYIIDLFLPTGFLSFFSPIILFLSSPAIFLNLITGWPYAHSIQYHYTIAIIPFIFFSLIYGFSWVRKKTMKIKKYNLNKIIPVIFMVIFLVSTIYGSFEIDHYDTSIRNIDKLFKYKIGEFFKKQENDKIRYEAISLIPDNTSVSASYLLLPHLTHRKIIYMFPNPFEESYWGLMYGNFTPSTPTLVTDYIIVDDTVSDSEKESIIDPFINQNLYEVIFNETNVIVLKKTLN